MIIYQIKNTVNSKIYIGKTTKTPEERLKKHFYNAKYGSVTYLYRAIRKYGESNFSISIIEETFDNLNEREKYWIQKLNPEYNMTIGGDGGDTSNSPNYKEAIREYHSKKSSKDYATYGMLGKSTSQLTKNKISKANSHPIMCDGILYNSINDAQLAYPGISIRKRLDSAKYPNFYRLKPKRKYP
jgi:group I intron endonuclease